MTNYLKVDFANSLIIMDRTFAKNVQNTFSNEYAHLQAVRKDYPTFTVITRKIKKNDSKESYKGLTYDYMKWYILNHGSYEKRIKCLEEYDALMEIAMCHRKGKRYPTIKKWFLAAYPEVVKFGLILKPQYGDCGLDDDIIQTDAEEIDFIDEELSA